jgi:chromosome partitioning protein
MKLIAVVNLKGGVGKSTIAVNVACEVAARRDSVVLVDADEQGTSVQWARSGRLPISVEALPMTRDARHWIQRVFSIKAGTVVVDCPPRLAAATEAAVGLADLAIVPVGASGADLTATTAALDLIRQAGKVRKDHGPRCLLIPSRIDRRTLSGREIDGALAGLGFPVAPAVHQRASMVDAFSSGQWIGDYAPGSPAHVDIQALVDAILAKR